MASWKYTVSPNKSNCIGKNQISVLIYELHYTERRDPAYVLNSVWRRNGMGVDHGGVPRHGGAANGAGREVQLTGGPGAWQRSLLF
jgi:hypothetical protein